VKEVAGTVVAVARIKDTSALRTFDGLLVIDLCGGDNLPVVECSERHDQLKQNTWSA
jgi:hypothetical protein